MSAATQGGQLSLTWSGVQSNLFLGVNRYGYARSSVSIRLSRGAVTINAAGRKAQFSSDLQRLQTKSGKLAHLYFDPPPFSPKKERRMLCRPRQL